MASKGYNDLTFAFEYVRVCRLIKYFELEQFYTMLETHDEMYDVDTSYLSEQDINLNIEDAISAVEVWIMTNA